MERVIVTVKQFLVFTFIACSCLVIGIYLYHLYRYPKFQSRDHLSKWYSENFILKTGSYLETPEKRIQHFLNFSILKQKGVIRIGTFGDSFTYGDEVNKKGSYPYFLQQLFNKKFPEKKIEILNFGVRGSGFQEQFFFWKEYSKKYSLDYVLLGPLCFQPDRDLTFGKPTTMSRPLSGVKNRFVLSRGGSLKEVFLKGNTKEKRLERYYHFIPSLTALFYDKRPFEVLETLFPFFRGRILNPFYYKKIPESEEAVQINSLLLKKMVKVHNEKILFFTLNPFVFKQYQSNGALYNLNFIPSPEEQDLYEVFSHKSSLGNEFVAKVFFNALTGKKSFHIKTIQCYFTNNQVVRGGLNKNIGLFEVESIQLIDGKNILSTLRQNSSDHTYTEGTYRKHKSEETKSFISFSPLFSGAPFFPVSIKLKESMKIHIQSENGDKKELGSIKAMDSYKKFFVLHQNSIHGMDDTDTHRFSYLIVKQDPLHKRKYSIAQKFQVFAEDYKLGTLSISENPSFKQQKNIFKFIPNEGYKNSFLMMGFQDHIKEEFLPDEFPVYLQYNMENGEKLKTPVPWKCEKKNKEFHLNLPNFKSLQI